MSEMDEVFDPSLALHVNFTDKEATSAAFDELPIGKYTAFITDCVPTQCGPNSKNPGKWYYALEATLDGGKYDNRKAWTNAMLFEGALYTISQIMKAIPALKGRVSGGEVQLPTPEELIGQQIKVHIQRGKAQVGEGTKENPQYPARNEWRGTSSSDASSASQAGSLLP